MVFLQRYCNFIWHQWFCPQISYYYRTSVIFPVDIVFLYVIDGFSHRYRIWYDINGFAHRYCIFLLHLLVFHIYIVFLYDINGFSYRYLLRYQWFCPYISYFYMTSTCFPHRYRIFIWHPLDFPIDIVFLHNINGFSHRYL